MIKENNINVAHPRNNEELFGFNHNEKYFLNLIKKNRISNNYIFNGIKGIGKATFAYRLARFIFAKQDVLDSTKNLFISKESKIFKSVENLIHPDLHVVEKDIEKKKINTEQLKLLDKITYVTSIESKYKIIIIDSLDDLTTKKSFSTLLKLLEECPINCIFILISHSLTKVPSTIRSRCQKIYFRPIPNEKIKQWFENSKIIDENKLNILINLANGSLGRALNIINNKEFFDIYIKAEKLIKNFKKCTTNEINDFFNLFNKQLSLEDFLSILQINIITFIKELLIKDEKFKKTNIETQIFLFKEIGKKINNFKSLDLDAIQTLNTLKYIFIKHSVQLNKI